MSNTDDRRELCSRAQPCEQFFCCIRAIDIAKLQRLFDSLLFDDESRVAESDSLEHACTVVVSRASPSTRKQWEPETSGVSLLVTTSICGRDCASCNEKMANLIDDEPPLIVKIDIVFKMTSSSSSSSSEEVLLTLMNEYWAVRQN